MEYDEDQVLTDYILHNYFHLATSEEGLLWNAMLAKHKAVELPDRLARLVRAIEDPVLVEALNRGTDAFCRTLRERIVQAGADQITINRCPKCDRIVRTPKARQCLWCGHDWHQ